MDVSNTSVGGSTHKTMTQASKKTHKYETFYSYIELMLSNNPTNSANLSLYQILNAA